MKCRNTNQAKRTKKLSGAVCLTALLLLGTGLAGCAGPAETAEEIVRPKESVQETEQSAGTAQAAEGGIAGQVQAPDLYQVEFTDESGRIKVQVDARVVVPQGEGFRKKSVTGRTFTQEDYERVVDVLLGGGELWQRAADDTDPAHGFTRAEIEERLELLGRRLERLGERQEAGEDVESETGIVENSIREFEKMLPYAPEEAETKVIEPNVRYDKDAALSGNSEANWLYGFVTVEGENGAVDYAVDLDNNITPDWRWIRFDVKRESGSWQPEAEPAGEEELKGKKEEIRAQAVEAVKKLGFTEMEPAGEEFFCRLAFDEAVSDEPVEKSFAYGVTFTRSIDGIPVTYTHDAGTASEAGDACWPYESLRLIYDAQGLLSFEWTDPYTVNDLSPEYVFLLPFEEIQQVFRKMIVENYQDQTEQGVSLDIRIDEIRLGYMRIMEKGNPTEGTMVPVWDFLGSCVRKIPGENGESWTEEWNGPYESWLTINAMDGTVIDREMGY